jgi:hypothetical protein
VAQLAVDSTAEAAEASTVVVVAEASTAAEAEAVTANPPRKKAGIGSQQQRCLPSLFLH